MRLTILTATAVSLAACSGGESANNESSGGSAAVEPTPGNLSVHPQNMVVLLDPPGNTAVRSPVPLPTAGPVALATIPTGFQGRWGMVPNDCDPKRADNKGLLTITGNRFSFYESRGEANSIHRTRPTQVTFDLPMSGEGQTWSEPTTLTLLDDGKTLVRQKGVMLELPEVTRYSRCPA